MKKIIIEIEEPCYEDAINDTEWDTLSLGIYLKELVKNGKPLQAELEEIKAEMHKNSYMKPMGNFNDEFDEECRAIDMDDVNYILDKRITELKGEQE